MGDLGLRLWLVALDFVAELVLLRNVVRSFPVALRVVRDFDVAELERFWCFRPTRLSDTESFKRFGESLPFLDFRRLGDRQLLFRLRLGLALYFFSFGLLTELDLLRPAALRLSFKRGFFLEIGELGADRRLRKSGSVEVVVDAACLPESNETTLPSGSSGFNAANVTSFRLHLLLLL